MNKNALALSYASPNIIAHQYLTFHQAKQYLLLYCNLETEEMTKDPSFKVAINPIYSIQLPFTLFS